MVLGGDESTPVLTQMEGRIDSLECQLEQAIERDRENRRIIAALTQRIPAIEAPESPTEATEQPGRETSGGGRRLTGGHRAVAAVLVVYSDTRKD